MVLQLEGIDFPRVMQNRGYKRQIAFLRSANLRFRMGEIEQPRRQEAKSVGRDEVRNAEWGVRNEEFQRRLSSTATSTRVGPLGAA